MRALTLKPHWAHAVAHLGKRIENRSTPIPPDLIGERVAIHAGATLPKAWLDELDLAYPGTSWDRRRVHGCLVPAEFPVLNEDVSPNLIRSRAIVATAVLAGCIKSAGWPDGYDWVPDWADPAAAYWWTLSDVITLDEPIPWQRGQLGLWHIDRREGGTEVVERLRVTP